MDTLNQVADTLVEAVQFFADPDISLEFVARLCCPDGVTCPHCEAPEPFFLATRLIWKCRDCRFLDYARRVIAVPKSGE